MTDDLSHISPQGEARMVDVSAKPETNRTARAGGSIRMRPETLSAIEGAQIKKGDVMSVARLAGVMAAKKTADLIPLCHPLALTDVQVTLTADPSLSAIHCEAVVSTVGRTGVEMEALTAVAVSLLTIYDMAKAIDREMFISDISLIEKVGGRSGKWSRVDGTRVAP